MNMQQSEGGETRPWHQRRNAARVARRQREREEIAEAARLGVEVVPKLQIDLTWTEEEDAIVAHFRDDMASSIRLLPGRKESTIRKRRQKLGFVSHHPKEWTSKEEGIIRDNLLKVAHQGELAALLPGRTRGSIKRHLDVMGLKIPRPAADTGSDLVNAIKDRCRVLGYTMEELDKIAGTGGYFTHRTWRNKGHIVFTSGALTKAIKVLGGTLRVDWPDDGESIDTIDVSEE